MNFLEVKNNIQEISSQFAAQRRERQTRRALFRTDFDDLISAGLHLTGVLAQHGGLWDSIPGSVRQICDLLRILAHGDSSVALVSSMHPGVLSLWLATPQIAKPHDREWQEQRNFCSEVAQKGHLWGTITSEPGSGGDIMNTKTRAYRIADGYEISGLKHFGSGTGMMSYMITTALVPDEAVPDIFYVDMRDVPLDGSQGAKLMFPWDGHGMIATQSHSVQFESFPATRIAWAGHLFELSAPLNTFASCIFTSVIVGIIEVAVATARKQLEKRHKKMLAYEQVEWTRIEMESWLIQQAYEGMLVSVEQQSPVSQRETLLGKTAVAELAETVMTRLCKVMGGGTYSRHSPFGFWFQDVRALGFLRPPWVLAFDKLFQDGWLPDAPTL